MDTSLQFELDIAALILRQELPYTASRSILEFIKSWFGQNNKALQKSFLDREKTRQIAREVYGPFMHA